MTGPTPRPACFFLFDDAAELERRGAACASGWKFGLKLAAEPAEN